MIRINLLPVRETKRQADVRQQGMLLGATALAALVICGVFHASQMSVLARRNADVNAVNQELAELKPVRDRVAQFTQERTEIERKLGVIASLEASRQGPVRIMDEIATRIPKRMWLRSLSMKAGQLQLTGVSLDAEIVAAFLTGLGESPFIDNVELEETKLEETEGLKLNTFKLRSAYPFTNYAAPDPTAMTAGNPAPAPPAAKSAVE